MPASLVWCKDCLLIGTDGDPTKSDLPNARMEKDYSGCFHASSAGASECAVWQISDMPEFVSGTRRQLEIRKHVLTVRPAVIQNSPFGIFTTFQLSSTALRFKVIACMAVDNTFLKGMPEISSQRSVHAAKNTLQLFFRKCTILVSVQSLQHVPCMFLVQV